MNQVSKKVILRNSVWGVAGQVVPSLVSLLVLPILFRGLGPEKFGVWTLLMVIVNYASIGDIGIPSALIKQISEIDYWKSGDRLSRLVSSGIVLNAALGIIIAFGVYSTRQILLEDVLRVPAVQIPESEKALIVGCGAFLVLMLARSLGAVLEGFQRMDYSNGAAALGSLVSGLGMVGSVLLGWGLVGLMWAWSAGGVVRCVVSIALIHLHYPSSLFSLRSIDGPTMRPLLRYGLTVQASSIATLLSEPLVKLLLSAFRLTDLGRLFRAWIEDR